MRERMKTFVFLALSIAAVALLSRTPHVGVLSNPRNTETGVVGHAQDVSPPSVQKAIYDVFLLEQDAEEMARKLKGLKHSLRSLATAGPPNKQAEAATVTVFADLACPAVDAKGFEEISSTAEDHGMNIKKYSNHADKDKEACKKGTWNLVDNEAHQEFTRRIINRLGVKRGDSVYDWGSGCGDTLGWMYQWEGVNGFGVDVVEAAVESAKVKYPGPRYCTGNAANMSTIPDERFEHAVAIGTIYHLGEYNTICQTLRDMLRIVKKGGKVLASYNHDKMWEKAGRPDVFPRTRVAVCVGDIAMVQVTSDHHFLGKGFAPYLQAHLRPHGKTYTVILTKHPGDLAGDALREYMSKVADANQRSVISGEKYMAWLTPKMRI